MKLQFRRSLPLLLVLPGTLVVLAFLVLPVAGTFSGTIGPSGNRFALYDSFFSNSTNVRIVIRTIRIALISTFISLVFGFVAATVLVRTRGWLRQILLVASVFPLLTGAIVRSFAWMVILGRNGIINSSLVSIGAIDEPLTLLFTEFSLIIGLVYLFTPLAILSLMGVLEAIDESVLDASASLGATPFAVFRQVTLPLAVPGLIVGGVLVFTGSLAAFATARLLGGEGQKILPALLHEKAMVSFDWDSANTIAVVMVALTVVVIVGAQYLARRLNPVTG
ncbi:ABC transporter permease [Rhizobium sp. GR12]|uniref:ABC transporter permease n=1 Tax=Rhizobium TaxID=379 RepID=UPI002FBE9BD4